MASSASSCHEWPIQAVSIRAARFRRVVRACHHTRARRQGWREQISQRVGLISYSYLVTREDLEGDGRGYLPRPTDQRHTASAYLEDQVEALRWKWVKASRFHLRVLYGSGLPYTPKVADTSQDLALVDGPRNSRRDHSYFRFDLGLTQAVHHGGWALQVQEDVDNVFDQYNAVGHTYLPTPAGTPVALRHTLGRRVYSIAVSVRYSAGPHSASDGR